MKKTFYINFILGSILLLVMFINLSVISVIYTFGPENLYDISSYIGVGILDIIYLLVIIIVNYKLFKETVNCSLKTVLTKCIVPLLIPMFIAVLVIMLWGMLENTPKQAIPKQTDFDGIKIKRV